MQIKGLKYVRLGGLMSNQDLHRILTLSKRIEEYQYRLEEIEQLAISCCSPNYSGMPKATSFDNQMERYVEAKERLEEVLAELKAEVLKLDRQLLHDIKHMSDDEKRIIVMRFIDLQSQSEIAKELGIWRKKVWRVLNKIGFRE